MSVLIDEAHRLDHISSVPTTFLMCEGAKYHGGLRIALSLELSVEANEFLKDKDRWKDWFKWLIYGDQKELQYERTTLSKILGVPLKSWDEDNFFSNC